MFSNSTNIVFRNCDYNTNQSKSNFYFSKNIHCCFNTQTVSFPPPFSVNVKGLTLTFTWDVCRAAILPRTQTKHEQLSHTTSPFPANCNMTQPRAKCTRCCAAGTKNYKQESSGNIWRTETPSINLFLKKCPSMKGKILFIGKMCN